MFVETLIYTYVRREDMNDEFQTESIFSVVLQVIQIFQYISMPPDKKKQKTKKTLKIQSVCKKIKTFPFESEY